MIQQKALHFFEQQTGQKADEFRALPQSGSERINFIATSGNRKQVITSNQNLRENEAFFYFSDLFSNLKLNTPEISAISPDRKMYIQQFLGDHSLSEIISTEGLSARVKALVKQVLEKLFALQQATKGKFDVKKTFEYERYDALPVTHDLYYFKNFIADVLDLHYHKSLLLKEFQIIAGQIEDIEPKVLMIRDFQSRNILVDNDDAVSFIDYQAAMEGPAMYDAISFLYQAKANFPEDFKTEMLNYFISLYQNEPERHQLKVSVKPLQLMRFLQVLGAYGLRGLVQRKPHFIQSLPQGIKNLTEFAQEWEQMADFPELQKVILQLGKNSIKEKIKEILNLKST